MLDEYSVSETDLIQNLARLDRRKIIEILPKNRIRQLISSNFSWLENGPIQRFFLAKVEQAFFASWFDMASEKLISVSGWLSSTSNEFFQRKMEPLAEEFTELQSTMKAWHAANSGGRRWYW